MATYREQCYAWLDAHAHDQCAGMGLKECARYLWGQTDVPGTVRTLEGYVCDWHGQAADSPLAPRVNGETRADEQGRAHGGHDRVAPVEEGQREVWLRENYEHYAHPYDLDADDDETNDAFSLDWDRDRYVFRIAGHRFDESFSNVWDWVIWYVRDGFNVTQRTITRMAVTLQGGTLTKSFVRRIFVVLGITKAAPPYPPDKLLKHDPDTLAKLHFSKLQADAEVGLRRNETKHYRKLWRDEVRKSLRVRDLLDELGGLPEAEWRIEVNPLDRDEYATAEAHTPVVLLTDWHVGKAVDVERNRYTKAIFYRRVERVLAEIEEHYQCYSRPLDQIQIAFAGDMCDGVSGQMHRDQALHQWAHGAKQIQIAATAMARVVRHIRDRLDCAVEVHSIGGNHDRISDHRDDDMRLVAGEAAYLWAADALGRACEWTHHEGIVAHWWCYDTRVIMIHGHAKPRNLRDLVWMHRHPDASSYLVLSGHLHSLKVDGVVDDTDVHYVRGPSLVGTDEYAAQQIGKGARPAQALVEVRPSGPRPVTYLLADG